MKKLILFFIILLIAVGLGSLIHSHPAHIFISMGSTTVQASLWVALIALVVCIFLVQKIVRLIRGITHLPQSVQHFIQDKRTQTLQRWARKARCAGLEENWAISEAYFYKSAKKNKAPFFDYLSAAHAAFEQKKIEEACAYLKKAQKIAKPQEMLTLEIMQVREQLETENYQKAEEMLDTLQKKVPAHPFILQGLAKVYLLSQNWKKLGALLPELKSHSVFTPHDFETLERMAYEALLMQVGQEKSLPALDACWESIPKRLHENPEIVALYVKYLIEQNKQDKAEKILKTALANEMNAALLKVYTQLQSKNSVKQLASAELWLKKYPDNADLLFCLGKLCMRYRIWGKAKTYLELSLKHKSQAETYLVLGEVLEQLEQKHAALDCYKVGLQRFIV